MRKINDNLIGELLNGKLKPLFDYVKNDNELRLEVRQKGNAFIYYRKGKVLEIKNLKVAKEYGAVPDTNLAITNPSEYFKSIKKSVDNWLETKKDRPEFDTQQNIATANEGILDKYLILDMEYAFEQNQIKKENREKRAVFDLLGIERETNRIVFFEVKKGLGATKGKSGVEDHIKDFKDYLYGGNSKLFRKNLYSDVKNIIDDKTKLGLFKFPIVFDDNKMGEPELVFVFHPNNNSEIDVFRTELKDRYKLLIVNENSFKLN